MSNKKEGFEITQERIDVINTATEYLHKLNDLEKWCTDNFHGTNVGQCYYIFEDFVRSTKHLMPKITKGMPPPS
jgi:hypothetical protein